MAITMACHSRLRSLIELFPLRHLEQLFRFHGPIIKACCKVHKEIYEKQFGGACGQNTGQALTAPAVTCRVSPGYGGIRLKIAPGYDVECVQAVRDAIGEGVDLRVDCNQGYRVSEAVKMIRNHFP